MMTDAVEKFQSYKQLAEAKQGETVRLHGEIVKRDEEIRDLKTARNSLGSALLKIEGICNNAFVRRHFGPRDIAGIAVLASMALNHNGISPLRDPQFWAGAGEGWSDKSSLTEIENPLDRQTPDPREVFDQATIDRYFGGLKK